MFLIDTSTTSTSDFNALKDYLQLMVEQMDIESGNVRVGLVLFGSRTQREFTVSKYNREDDIINHITSTRKLSTGQRHTAAGEYSVKNSCL